MVEPSRKRQRAEPPPDDPFAPGGLYDFLPPPDPEKDAAAKTAADKANAPRPKLPEEDRSRVIFLDVDGVILASGSIETIVVDGVTLPKRHNGVQESDFTTAALGSLRSIIEQTGAGVVLSSEWRRTEALKGSIQAVLSNQDMPRFRDSTPIFNPKPEFQKVNPILAWCERRAREIGTWLKAHPEVTSWVVLDDLDFAMADNVRAAGTPYIKHRSIHTNDRICLTEDDAKEAVRILVSPPQDDRTSTRKTSQVVEVAEEGRGNFLVSTEDSGAERIRLG